MSCIAGIINSKKKINIFNQLNIQKDHDKSNIYFSDSALMIQDADKPNTAEAYFERNGIVIIYDGTIYNYDELYAGLILKNHSLSRNSFAELIYCSYLEYGIDCFSNFDGTFTAAIWNSNNRKLVIARDKFGIEPLFYSIIDDEFIFASDIKTLFLHPYIRPEIDSDSIAELLLVGPGRTPGYAIFKNITELKAAHVAVFSEDDFSLKQYWKLKAKPHEDSFNDTKEHIRYLIAKSIERQTETDGTICTFLSGGLDSSIVTAMSGVKNTFSVDYEDNDKFFSANQFQPERDTEYINIMKNFLGTNHTTILLTPKELIESLYLSVEARDLPGMADVDGSMLLLCKEAKKHAKVALTGECADEFFGGYPWYRNENLRNTDRKSVV